MKTYNSIVLLSIAFCLTLMTMPLHGQGSVVYNNDSTSGSLTLLATDCPPGWEYYCLGIKVPVNTPIKITLVLNYEVEVLISTSEILPDVDPIFGTDEPDSLVSTRISVNGMLFADIYNNLNITPSNNVLKITFQVDSTNHSQTDDLYVPGKLNAGSDLDVYGNTNINGNTRINRRLGVGEAAYNSKIYVANYNQDNHAIYLSSSKSSTSSLFGLYSSASNGTGNVYGIYSTVSGVAGKKWAGYFNGGDLEVNGGNLKVSGGSTLMGNVGIGTVTPLAKLHINSGANNNYATILATSNEGNNLVVSSHDTQPHSCTVFKISHEYSNNPAKRNNGYISFYRGASDEGGFLEFGTYGLPRMIIDPSGKVGIGTSAPDEMLTVNGKIHAKEVIVALTGPLADYVFEPEYRLKPLHEVEQFVKTNKHLPGIPSAAQVEEKGLSMGEMQNKLLQKVEELTLYIIEQDKKIKMLEEKLK